MKTTFIWPVRVYIEDTDFGGVVFYGNYLKFFERARTEWLRTLGINQNTLISTSGIVFVVKEISVKYLAPARLDDEIQLTVTVERLKKASLFFQQEAWRGDTLLASADVQIVSVAMPDFRPAAIPQEILRKMQE